MPFKNLAYGIVATAPSPATTGTSLVLQSGQGANFPNADVDGAYWVTACPSGFDPSVSNSEILQVTSDTTDTLTIVRHERGTTAKSIDVGWRIFQGIYAEDQAGLASIIVNELVNETPNGSITSFTVDYSYIAGTTQVYRDGQLMCAGSGNDYTESADKTIAFTTAPVTGSIILVTYQKVISTVGNANTVDGFDANATPTANNIPVLNGVGHLPADTLPLADGTLYNGKIVTSVTSNNLTVAIKGHDGNDPSATNPVYIKLGSTIRAIVAALSVTKNAGTNWFNAGSAELATKEVDYFVYLGYNATDGVTLGFARIPYARLYSDFSTTTTSANYCAISTITNAIAGNEYSVIGRFNAILSATSAFNWSIPGTSIIINRPIYETRVLDWIPQYSCAGSMTLSATSTSLAKYKILVDKIEGKLTCALTTAGSAANAIYATLPFLDAVPTITVIGIANTADGVVALGLLDLDGSTHTRLRMIHPGFANWAIGANMGTVYGSFLSYPII